MAKTKKDKTMKVEILGANKKVGVMLNGEIRNPGDVVEVGLLTGKSLIARERAKPYTKDTAKTSDKDTPKASDKGTK